jgi:hypothetical protein
MGTAVYGGSGEGGKIVNREAVGNVLSGGDDHLDGLNGHLNNGQQ